MAEFIEIKGGTPLHGSLQVSGAKNAALPMLLASLLTSEACEFDNVPNLEDINLTINLLEHFGAQVEHQGHKVKVCVPQLLATEASYSLVKALRASFWVLGPLLARGGAARVALPGGDIIGPRPVDMHIHALEQLGAEIKVKHGVVYATAPQGLKGRKITLRSASVGATHQIIMAASLARGVTTIEGAAREPEIVAVAELISAMGAMVEGAGTSTITIHGRETLGGAKVRVIGDRIEAGTYLLAALATSGSLRLEGIDPSFFGEFLEVLAAMQVGVELGKDWISVRSNGRIKPVKVSTNPFPLLATDLQAPLMAALCMADGESQIEENIFEGRYGHVSELCRMGAQISVEDRVATIRGIPRLSGAEVEGFDIRAAASLVIAGLAAEGTTYLYEPQHIRRGYDSLEQKLQSLGAQISCKTADVEDYMFAGC